MKERWYSTNCYVKRIPSDTTENVMDWDKGLYAISPLKKDQLLASFSNDEIFETKHFLRHSENANCYIKGRDVFAKFDIPSETELTLYYHGILL